MVTVANIASLLGCSRSSDTGSHRYVLGGDGRDHEFHESQQYIAPIYIQTFIYKHQESEFSSLYEQTTYTPISARGWAKGVGVAWYSEVDSKLRLFASSAPAQLDHIQEITQWMYGPCYTLFISSGSGSLWSWSAWMTLSCIYWVGWRNKHEQVFHWSGHFRLKACLGRDA
jgi:hypothetical protein